MDGGYDRLLAAQEDLAFLVSDLQGLSGQLEELATAVRRAGVPTMPELQPGFHKRVTDAVQRLAATLHAFVDAGTEQPPNLAFSSAAQLSALESDIGAVVAAADGDRFRSEDAGIGAVVMRTLRRIRKRLWSLISHLARVREWSLRGEAGGGIPGLAEESIHVTFG